ncbi:MAG: S8 family peptidase [Lachnospiraceae bacterium]|nr:S8 family peptidase [Lachnospiraceae bacterium]
MNRVRAQLHADEVHAAGFTGRGITAAVLDSGICFHPDYAHRIIAFRDFVNGKAVCYDDASHGSHVSGILGGDGSSSRGRYCGIAPGCSLVHLKVLDRYGQGKLEDIIAAMEWVIRNRERHNIRIMNLSAGTSKGEDDYNAKRLVQEVERAWDAGIVVVVAAGNMGPEPRSITVPGNSRKVITVGASDDFRGKGRYAKAEYSGCGPTEECICKPELVAPGTGIYSCSPYWKQGRYYSVKSGTSMAAPAVAGGIALLLEKEPFLTNVKVKMRLKETAVDLGYPKNRQGWGIPDLRRLLGIK